MTTKNKIPYFLDIMPQIEDYEAFKKYMLKARKELKTNLRYDVKNNMLTIGNKKVYFNSYINCMCYIEGYKRCLENEN